MIKYSRVIYAILMGLLIVSIIVYNYSKDNKSKIVPKVDLPKPSKKTSKVVILDTFFSEEALKQEIDSQGIMFPDIVYKQARLETGNFKSAVFKNYHNLFGFMNRKGYIKYTTWKASVKDYRRWQVRFYSGGEYYQFLKDIRYAEDPEYVNKLRRM